MMKKQPFFLAVAFFLFIVVIVVLADQGNLPSIVTVLYNFPYGDKVGHFLLMGILSLLVNLSLPPRPLHGHILVTLGIIAVVALEEASQAWFGTRHPDIIDLAASLAGIVCLGALGWWLRRRRFQNQRPKKEARA
jgi:VanZ family protein